MNSDHLITRQVEEYIAYKRGLGFKIFIEAAELRRFARYAREARHDGPLTADLVLGWISLNPTHTRWYKARRLETVCTFARYAAIFDPRTEIPRNGIFGGCHGRRHPCIISQTEIRLLMHEARQLLSPDGLRGIAVSTALGLLWSSGLRPSELCALLVSDVDLEEGILHICETKFSKTRYVPLDAKTRDALKEYSDFRDSLYPCSPSGHLFLTTRGTQLTLRKLESAMGLVRRCLSVGSQIGAKQRTPRLYDLRHSFACMTIRRWLSAGDDINHRLLLLCAYLGHVRPSDTYWYLTGTPELFALVCARFEEQAASPILGDAYDD